jgi:hypothetical protein
VKHPWTINIHVEKKMDRRVKQVFSGMGTSGRGVGIREG